MLHCRKPGIRSQKDAKKSMSGVLKADSSGIYLPFFSKKVLWQIKENCNKEIVIFIMFAPFTIQCFLRFWRVTVTVTKLWHEISFPIKNEKSFLSSVTVTVTVVILITKCVNMLNNTVKKSSLPEKRGRKVGRPTSTTYYHEFVCTSRI